MKDSPADGKLNAIWLTLEVISTGVILYTVWRTMVGPDAQQRMVMRIAAAGEKACHKNAVAWANYADKCNKVYHNATNVSV